MTMTGRFTGGVVSYARRINLGSYEHAEAKSEIAWSADESSTMAHAAELAAKASQVAKAQVLAQLGLATEAPPVKIETPPVTFNREHLRDVLAQLGLNEPTMTPPVNGAGPMTVKQLQDAGLSITEIEHVETPPVTINREHVKSDAIIAIEAREPVVVKVEREEPAPAPIAEASRDLGEALRMAGLPPKRRRKVDTGTMVVEAETVEPAKVESFLPQRRVVPEPTEEAEDIPAAAPEITNRQISDACRGKMSELADAGDEFAGRKVHQLVGKYGTSGNAIPQERRQAFLAELALLTTGG